MTPRLRAAFVALAYWVAASYTLASFLTHWGPRIGVELESTLGLSQARPYVVRVLTPLLVRGLVALVPSRAVPALLDGWGHGVPGLLATSAGWVGPPTVERLACTWLLFASLLGTAFAWRSVARWAVPDRSLLADVVPAAGILALPATFARGGFLYDLPDLLLVSCCYLAFVRRRWVAWYSLLPVAVLNKEASVLVVVWWLAVRDTTPRRTWWAHAAASALLGAGVVVALAWYFRDRPGAFAQPNLVHNLGYWASFGWLFEWQDAFGMGVPQPVALDAIDLVVLAAVVGLGRRRVAPSVVRALAWSAAAVAPLLVFFGFEDEIRVFAVAIPPLVALGAGAADALYSPAVHVL
ncbi:MAG TPA: hypothetical protein VKU41_32180 [Polyangiaceae bacterium]|nr:hypothetical protein [Polyangiaceae bacterium]